MKSPSTRIGAIIIFIFTVLFQAFQVKLGIREKIDATIPSVVKTTHLEWQDRTYDWNYIVYPTAKTSQTTERDENAPIFNRTFGGVGSDIVNCSAMLRDSCFVIGGNSSSAISDFSGYTTGWKLPYGFVSKHSSNGDILWSRGIGGNGLTVVKDCAELADGSIVVVGYTLATNVVNKSASAANTVNGFIFRYSSSGVLLSSLSTDGNGYDYFYCVAALPGGGYAVGGCSDSSNGMFSFKSSSAGAVLFAFDSADSVVWSKSFESSTGAQFNSMDSDSQGNIFTCLVSNSTDGDLAAFEGFGAGGNDSLVCKFDSLGNLKWGRAIAGTGNDQFSCIAANEEGGCCAAGYYETLHNSGVMDGTFADYYNFGGEDGFAFFIDSNGNIINGTAIAGIDDDRITDVFFNGTGYVFGGYTKSYNRTFAEVGNLGDFDAFAAFCDPLGNVSRVVSFSGSECDRTFTVCGNGTDVIICGATSSCDEFFDSASPVPDSPDTVFAVKLSN